MENLYTLYKLLKKIYFKITGDGQVWRQLIYIILYRLYVFYKFFLFFLKNNFIREYYINACNEVEEIIFSFFLKKKKVYLISTTQLNLVDKYSKKSTIKQLSLGCLFFVKKHYKHIIVILVITLITLYVII